jgi:Fis family transcriptional regulator
MTFSQASMSPASINPTPVQNSADESIPKIDVTVRKALERYFQTLGDEKPHALYDMVVSAAERPLLEYVMARYSGNVSHAALALGITRNTLRKKLALHAIANPHLTPKL